jgi:choline kinase
VSQNPDLAVLIPAAGQGLRLGAGIPKALVTICGRPIIEWQLKSLKSFEGPITVIVGYQADEVVNFVSSLNSRVQFIYNADFKTTGTASSLLLAAKCVNTGSILAIDGDVLVKPLSLFRLMAATGTVLGVTRNLTEDGVRVDVDKNNILSFTGDATSIFEWSGVFKAPTNFVQEFRDRHVYDDLAQKLPIRFEEVDCIEVDTPEDLVQAEAWMGKAERFF